MSWKAVFENPVDKHGAYRAAVAADAAWSRELQRVYGKRAGDARYDKRGVATPELRRLHDAWVAAERRRENPTKPWQVALQVTSPSRPNLRHQLLYTVQAGNQEEAVARAKQMSVRDGNTVMEVISVRRGYR